MNIENFRNFCLAKKGVTEEFPFDNTTLVFKVMGKMFALTDVEIFKSVNLKCDPNKAIIIREQYDAVKSGYHMNKKHWNTVENNGSIPDKLFFEWIDDSYHLVVAKLSKKQQQILSESK